MTTLGDLDTILAADFLTPSDRATAQDLRAALATALASQAAALDAPTSVVPSTYQADLAAYQRTRAALVLAVARGVTVVYEQSGLVPPSPIDGSEQSTVLQAYVDNAAALVTDASPALARDALGWTRDNVAALLSIRPPSPPQSASSSTAVVTTTAAVTAADAKAREFIAYYAPAPSVASLLATTVSARLEWVQNAVLGADFSLQSLVTINGTPVDSRAWSPRRLQFVVPAAMRTTPGTTLTVGVVTPPPGGGVASTTLTLTVV